jgi:hypothetical protein
MKKQKKILRTHHIERNNQESHLAEVCDNPYVKLAYVEKKLGDVARFQLGFSIFVGIAQSYQQAKTTPERFPYLELARVTYQTLKESFGNNNLGNPLINEAMDSIRDAYPVLFQQLTEPRREK